MVNTTTSESLPWADGPWELIETPSKTQDISKNVAFHIANEMAFAHNAMLRGLNALYLQAEQVSEPGDITDFLFFLHAWAGWVTHHHSLEEEQMFPQFEEVMKQPKFLEGNVAEHHTFQPILKQLFEYSVKTKPDEYSASTVRGLIEQMAPSFRQHLANEIPTLMAMMPYDGDALSKVWQGCEAEAAKQDKHTIPPMVFGLRDVTFEGGNQWPNTSSAAVQYVEDVFAQKHAGAWRFLPSNIWGQPRPLEFLKK